MPRWLNILFITLSVDLDLGGTPTVLHDEADICANLEIAYRLGEALEIGD